LPQGAYFYFDTAQVGQYQPRTFEQRGEIVVLERVNWQFPWPTAAPHVANGLLDSRNERTSMPSEKLRRCQITYSNAR
jgi:hypothetical protein